MYQTTYAVFSLWTVDTFRKASANGGETGSDGSADQFSGEDSRFYKKIWHVGIYVCRTIVFFCVVKIKFFNVKRVWATMWVVGVAAVYVMLSTGWLFGSDDVIALLKSIGKKETSLILWN